MVKEETKNFKGKYFESKGRRKTSVARVRLFKEKGDIIVNDIDYKKYFQTEELQRIIESVLNEIALFGKVSMTIKTSGGGIHSQAEAVRLGIARALVAMNADFKDILKVSGHLTRDSRMRERKKPGLKRARKSPQWSKR